MVPRLGETFVVAHPGAQHSRETAFAIQKCGLLKAYVTGFYYEPAGFLGRLAALSKRIDRELRRRYKAEIAPELVRVCPWGELLCVVAVRMRLPGSLTGSLGSWRNRRFDGFVASLIRRECPGAVICYDTCALQSFKAAEDTGTLRILDQSVGHWRTLAGIMREESELHPEFADSLPANLSDDFLDARTRESLLADHVLAGSQYVKDTMVQHGVAPDRVTVLPYGVDIQRFRPAKSSDGGSLRILFVGQLSQRKGIKYLLEALRQLRIPRLQTTLIGGIVGSGKALTAYGNYFNHINYVPHHEVHRHFQQADIFVYPSLHEGSALAVYEALASGLPVITTPNSGSVVRNGVDGFIVPIRDVEALKENIVALLENSEMREEMARNARRRSELFTWEAYRRRLATLLRRLLPSAVVADEPPPHREVASVTGRT